MNNVDGFLNIGSDNPGMVPSKIFEYGVSNGSGEGIGLYSAADFLRKFGSTIEIESTPNDKFTVHFIIKIPVYGKQV